MMKLANEFDLIFLSLWFDTFFSLLAIIKCTQGHIFYYTNKERKVEVGQDGEGLLRGGLGKSNLV